MTGTVMFVLLFLFDLLILYFFQAGCVHGSETTVQKVLLNTLLTFLLELYVGYIYICTYKGHHG